jgi:hypothetical protein
MPRARHAVPAAVELLVDSGRWPAGTTGTVVETDDERALVEISDDRGHTLDFIAVPPRHARRRARRRGALERAGRQADDHGRAVVNRGAEWWAEHHDASRR